MAKFIESLKYTFLYDLAFPIVQIPQLLAWKIKGKRLSPPHLIKQRLVKKFAKKYNLKVFIETGTYLGSMVNATKKTFRKIYTIELDEKLYKRAKNKFKGEKGIKVLFGDSSIVLPKVSKNITKPCLFWLDAHYSKGITTKGNKETSIIDELTVILNHEVKNHLLLIDDADKFNGENDYPTLKELKKFVLKKNQNLDLKVLNNIIIITPPFGQKEDT